MSFTVTFYQFTKKYNSTKRPTGGTSFDCVVKNGTGILSPRIELNIGLVSDPSAYNYAYIPAFDRYYTIREWQFDRTLWTAFLEVDVLATYKTQIGDASLYVLRASGEYDGTVVDNYYPCKAGCSYDKTAITSPYADYAFDPDQQTYGGSFIIGCVNGNAGFGSLQYYIVGRATMAAIYDYLISDVVTVANHFSLNDASLALQSAIVEPMQYIKSCIWMPFNVNAFHQGAAETVKIHEWTITDALGSPLTDPYANITITVNTKKHPDTNSRGNYVNAAPYTIAHLAFPPFGVIDLDTSVLCDVSSITLDLNIDPITGKGILEIKANNEVLNRLEAQIGVPIPLTQIKSDYVGAVSSIANGVSSVISGVMAGGPAGIAGAVAGGVGAIGNAVNALTPRAQTQGTGGCYSHLKGACELDFQFFRPVDDDIAQNGRPLCKMRQPKNIPGYMLIQDGDVPIPGTITEGEQIKAFLEGGFYYE